jgi:hypothetical protein
MVISAVSKRQISVSRSATESETVAADYATCQEGMPTLTLLATILGREVTLSMMGDNEAMIKIFYSGKNPTMRYLNRPREVAISWLMEVFELRDIKLRNRRAAARCRYWC